jgi:outer membrane protein assembly factor BamB
MHLPQMISWNIKSEKLSLVTILFLFLMKTIHAQETVDPASISDFNNLPAVAWKFKSTQPFIGSPVIDESLVYAGGLDSVLYALESSNGHVKWKFRTRGDIRCTPCISGNKVIFFSGDGNLYALDKATGKAIWSFQTKEDHQYDVYDYHQSSPVLYQERIYIGSGDGNVYSIAVADGKQLWSFKTGNVVHSTPALNDGKLYVGSMDGYVYSLDAANGSLLWKFKTVGHNYFPKGEVQFSPVVSNGIVYIGARDYNLYAIDAKAGVCRWNKEFPAGWVPAVMPSYKNDSVIYVHTSDPKVLLALNGLYEFTIWKTTMVSQVFGHSALSETYGYVGTLGGKFYGIDMKTGTIQWTFASDGYIQNHLRYYKADDTFRDDILSINKTNEDFIYSGYTCGSIYSTAALSNDLIIISSTDGTIYCLKRV